MSNETQRDIAARSEVQNENIEPQQHQLHHHQHPDQDHQSNRNNQHHLQYAKNDQQAGIPGPMNHMGSQYGQVPVMVSSYPSGTALQQFQFQQQAAYAQAMQNQYYQQPPPHHSQQPQMGIPPQLQQSPLPNGHMPQMQPLPELNPMAPQYHTPQRPMGAPALPHHPGVLMQKHGITPLGSPETQRKKQKRTNINGEDSELKALAYRSLDNSLEEVAAQVRAVELDNTSGTSTPVANDTKTQYKKDTAKERQRQIFGMVWLLKSCEAKSSAVVPRNRVYARYVSICADNGLKPLSPASFGKLVRAIFPNLSTRRLGMRGQSKYHYCGIKLIGENSNPSPGVSSSSTPLHNSAYDSSFLPGTPFDTGSPNSLTSTPLLSAATTATTAATTTTNNSGTINSFLNNHIAPELKFVPNLIESLSNQVPDSDKPLLLPQIRPFLPPSTDMDIADTLYGLYKSHCTSVFESLRYMQLKKLFSLLSSFHGSLTSPVLKLYVSPSLHNWIIASDSIMYKEIIKMLANLALQDIPTHVLQQLKQVAENFTEKSSTSLQNLPVKLAVAKLKLSKEFSQLVSKLIRVAETAQSANKVLSHDFDRELMEKDWTKFVDVEQIASKELPCNGENLKQAIEVLKNKLPELLNIETESRDTIINEWALFISELPHKFIDVPPRLFLLCVSTILTSALREISLAGGAGFGAWWVVRCWIDEWVGWCAELGGFISTQSFDVPIERKDESLQNGNKVNEEMPVDLLDGQFGIKKTNENGGNDNNGINQHEDTNQIDTDKAETNNVDTNHVESNDDESNQIVDTNQIVDGEIPKIENTAETN
ncbi:hypothetical protein BN7_2967 [Wickerhamomyces ciferrii]|uniref:RFX-type winged-helix domain-containing protein n=1 Tax=Wickerhamomyces ciferrii (strain ATCC 14091 / BCRC 22168 / CBS 111 / JCM 3599 / NBRC 0793 / NRRL Y-1031 F-60-10) TaxID=1206466 RepID=K0KPT1_WICCF|nr:uncharacterized protein BN7_2967 [Wickerhamomyces ciferrii]CCH43419.1 hypothetical protein BN7_2967 [Wickerhamomyces ciferrii]